MSFLEFLLSILRVTITLPQLVFVRVAFDDVAPRDLSTPEQRELARAMFGDIDEVPEAGRTVIACLKGARIGGSWISSLYLLYRACVASCKGLAAGEMAFTPIVAPDMKTGRQCSRYAHGAASSRPELKRMIESETADGFVLRRPDGRQVSIEVLAASRGGSALRGRSMVAALMDESSFFRDENSAINDAELYRAIAPRVLVGGKLAIISTAWMRSGLLWELVQRNHGAPQGAIAAICPTELMRPDSPQIARIVAEERARDPDNAAREFDCIPFDGAASSWIDGQAIDAMVDDTLSPFGALL